MSEELDKGVEKAAEEIKMFIERNYSTVGNAGNCEYPLRSMLSTYFGPLSFEQTELLKAKNAELAAKDAEIARLREGIEAVRGLMDESTGVYGLHRNGDGAPWSELEEEGQFEGWLAAFNKAEQALQGREKE